jgi:hypothetical protein
MVQRSARDSAMSIVYFRREHWRKQFGKGDRLASNLLRCGVGGSVSDRKLESYVGVGRSLDGLIEGLEGSAHPMPQASQTAQVKYDVLQSNLTANCQFV